MERRVLARLIVLALGFGVIAGCGQGKVKTVDVSGTVRLDGKPLDGVAVVFGTENHVGIGRTGADGTYRLEEGAEVGDNKVYFTEIGVSDGSEMPLDEMDVMDDMGEVRAGQLIPVKYSNALEPAVTFTVPQEGTTSAEFELTSD